MMTAGVDLVNAANQGSANSLKSFGAATAGAGGKVGMAGRAAGIFGEVLGAASTGLSELAKAGIGFMLGQTKQLIAGFQSMSAAGAVYSGGLISMTDTALSAGMTLDQFSKAVTQNRDAFARSGLGVAEGSKRMAAAMQKGGDAARNGMFALGMGLEEQADAYATTMAIMAGPSRKLNASNEQIAAQTQEYAKNMKVLSDLTGEDTKSKQEKLRQDNDTLAFQQILDGKSATEQARINDAMMNMNADQQRAFRENMIYGSVISKDLAIAQATNRGIAEFNTKTFKAAQDGSLSAEQTARLQKDTMQSTHDAAMANKGMAMATSADAQAASAINLRATQYTATFAKSEEERAKIAAEQAAGAKGAGGVAVDLMAQQQEMSIRMQALALTHLDSFSTALEESFKAAMLAVEALGKLANAVEENPLKSLFLSLAGPILSVVAALTQFGPSIFKAFKGTGGVGSAASSYLSKIGGASTVLKGVGLGVVGAAVGTGIQYGGDKLTEAGYEKTGKAVGVAGTATKYAGYGAMIGSVVPGVGTAIGAGIGGVVGAGKGIYDQYYAGNVGSEKLGKATTTATSASGTLKGVTGDQIRSHPNFKKYLAEEESYFPGSPENYASAAERVKEDMIKAQGAKIKTSSANQLTAPKPVAGQMTQNLAAEQTKLYGAVVDPAAAAAKAKAMEKPVASANPAEQQQISLLQSILATMQKNNSISSGILQNSY
jgi:hypothetical protein